MNLKKAAFRKPDSESVAIHTEIVLAGNIGSAARMEYTVIGDNMNIASRIEGLCRNTGATF